MLNKLDAIPTSARKRRRVSCYLSRSATRSQSILVLCDDDNYYVKMSGNPQGQNTLANELLGHQFIQAMRLPIPDYAFVPLSHAFVTAMYPYGWFELGTGIVRPRAGVHLGCRFVGRPNGKPRTSDFIGSRRIAAITNRTKFLGMVMVDAWADHQDQRQAVFYCDTRPGFLRAVFIDQGMMFDGSECVFKDDKCWAFFFGLAVYNGFWVPEVVDRWQSRLRQIAPKVLRGTYKFVPRGCYEELHEIARSALLSHIDSLDRLLEPYNERLSR